MDTSTHQSHPWAWWYRTVVVQVVLCLAIAGIGLLFGPDRWAASSSLAIITEYTHLPLRLLGIPLLAAAGLLCWERTRFVGYCMAAFLLLVLILLSWCYTLLPGRVTNLVIVAMSPLIVTTLLSGARFAAIATRRRR